MYWYFGALRKWSTIIMPKFKKPEVEVKFISNCFEVVIFLEYWRGGQRGYTPVPVYFLYIFLYVWYAQKLTGSLLWSQQETRHKELYEYKKKLAFNVLPRGQQISMWNV